MPTHGAAARLRLTARALAPRPAAAGHQPPRVRPATPADRQGVVETIVRAFVASPETDYFFRSEEGDRYDELAPTFFGGLFDGRCPSGTVWTTQGSSAVALWDAPPDAAEASKTGNRGDEHQQEQPAAPSPYPPDVLQRLARYNSIVHDLLPPDTEPFWYLGVLACHPSAQGSGLARQVARAAIDLAKEAGLVAYLETTNPRNVGIYRRAGWVVHAVSDELQPRLRIWVMRHDGRVAIDRSR